jgi:hypothetical protein
MPKVFLTNDPIERVSAIESPMMEFNLDIPPADNITNNGTLKVILSATEDFASITEHIPSQYEVYNTDWSVIVGNSVAPVNFNKELRCTIPAIGAQSLKYAKIMFTVDGIPYQSGAILITSFTLLVFSTKPIDVFGQVKPLKVKIKDKTNSILVGAPYTIRVDVCNNALETVPTWENATTAYTNDEFFTFTNITKTPAKNWAISVKYTITKANARDIIEITEVYVAYV